MKERFQVLSTRVSPEVYDWVRVRAAELTIKSRKRVTLSQVTELAIRKMMKNGKK